MGDGSREEMTKKQTEEQNQSARAVPNQEPVLLTLVFASNQIRISTSEI
jgi:hypothetical protein